MNVLSVVDVDPYRTPAVPVTAIAPTKVRITIARNPRRGRDSHSAPSLHVWRFDLQKTGIYVSRAIEVIAVKPVVLGPTSY